MNVAESNQLNQSSTAVHVVSNDQLKHVQNEVAACHPRLHTIDFKFFISELATKYNNENIAKAFQVEIPRVSEWREQHELLQQAYLEKYPMAAMSEFSSTGIACISNQSSAFLKPGLKPETVTSSGVRKKCSYSTEFKLRAVAYAEMATNRAAAKEFNVHDKRIREWRKNKAILMTSPKDRRRLRGAGRKPLYDNALEQSLFNWVDLASKENSPITTTDVQQKAIEFSASLLPAGTHFSATKDWVECFLKRHNLSIAEEVICFDNYSSTKEEESGNFLATMVAEDIPMQVTVCQEVGIIDNNADNL